MSLTPDNRLTAAAAFVRSGSVAADIGCDHGKLAIHLVQSGTCRRVLACDLRAQPLSVAQRNAAAAGVGAQIEFRLGNGFAAVQPEEATDFVLAGISGITITQLLAAAPWTKNARYNFVLVPATRAPELRCWLAQNGYALLRESCVQAQGRCYAAMNAQYTGVSTPCTHLQSLVGLVQKSENARTYLTGAAHHLQRQLAGAKESEKVQLLQTLAELNEVIRQCPQ